MSLVFSQRQDYSSNPIDYHKFQDVIIMVNLLFIEDELTSTYLMILLIIMHLFKFITGIKSDTRRQTDRHTDHVFPEGPTP